MRSHNVSFIPTHSGWIRIIRYICKVCIGKFIIDSSLSTSRCLWISDHLQIIRIRSAYLRHAHIQQCISFTKTYKIICIDLIFVFIQCFTCESMKFIKQKYTIDIITFKNLWIIDSWLSLRNICFTSIWSTIIKESVTIRLWIKRKLLRCNA